MYIYLYDNFLRDKKYTAHITACENRLTDFGIFGKIVRITTFTNPGKLIEDEMRRGAKTAVIVGNDDTFARVIARSADYKVVFGFLPVGSPQTIADLLGIPTTLASCDIVSRRKIEQIDVGVVNDRFFFRSIRLTGMGFRVTCDDTYSISPEGADAEIAISNLEVPEWIDADTRQYLKPQDGKLSVFVRPSKKALFGKKFIKPTMLQVKKAVIKADHPIVVTIDGIVSKEHYIEAKVSNTKFSIIVGKDRKF